MCPPSDRHADEGQHEGGRNWKTYFTAFFVAVAGVFAIIVLTSFIDPSALSGVEFKETPADTEIEDIELNETVVESGLLRADSISAVDVLRFGDAGTNIQITPENKTQRGIVIATMVSAAGVAELENRSEMQLGFVNIDVVISGERVVSAHAPKDLRRRCIESNLSQREYSLAVWQTRTAWQSNETKLPQSDSTRGAVARACCARENSGRREQAYHTVPQQLLPWGTMYHLQVRQNG